MYSEPSVSLPEAAPFTPIGFQLAPFLYPHNLLDIWSAAVNSIAFSPLIEPLVSGSLPNTGLR